MAEKTNKIMIDADDPQSWRIRLQAEMTIRGIGFPKMAELMACSYGQVQKMMQGRARHYHAFVKQAAQVLGLDETWLLTGRNEYDISCLMLSPKEVKKWLDGLKTEADQFITCPSVLSPGHRTFVWVQQSDELDDGASGWREGDYLYIDPDLPIHACDTPVVLARLQKGWIVRKLRDIGGDLWLVPGNRVYDAILVEEGVKEMVGVVIGGLRLSQHRL